MDFTVKTSGNWSTLKTDCLIVAVADSKKLNAPLKAINEQYNHIVTNIDKLGDLQKSIGSTNILHTDNNNIKRLLLVGTGKSFNQAQFCQLIAQSFKTLKSLNVRNISIALESFQNTEMETPQLIKQTCRIIESETYAYDTTLSKKAAKLKLTKVNLLTAKADAASKRAAIEGQSMAIGMNEAKQLGNLPANFCTPTHLAKKAQEFAKHYENLSCKVLNETQLKKLGMNAMLSVTAGTEEPAKLIIMEYKGGKASERPVALVGKGVTFDSGGISLKPGAKMDEMKYDMCGAASVFGTIKAIAELGLKANVVGIVAAVENMPSGKATKPGDVITSMSGQTIEILNTDAEGRLVLCDALTYVERFKPKSVIDIATLTGACVVALGKHASAVYSNDEGLSDKLLASGQAIHDRGWPMPLWEEYDRQLNSRFADMGNIGGPEAGSVTAACFLARFTKNLNWAHLDIAGAAWVSGAAKGATGRPVSMLTQYLIDHA